MVVRVFFLVFRVRDSPFLVMVGRVDKTHGSDTHERLWSTFFTEISFLHKFQFMFLGVITVDTICCGHISCQLVAVGTVRLPLSGRLIPFAAHTRSERSCKDSCFVSKFRSVCRSFKQSMRAFPPLFFGAGNLMFCVLIAPHNTVRTSIVKSIFMN